jgi:hypothetical protein
MPASLPPSSNPPQGITTSPVAGSGGVAAGVPPASRAPQHASDKRPSPTPLAFAAVAGIVISALLMMIMAYEGPSITEPRIPFAQPGHGPPFFVNAQPGTHLVSYSLWFAAVAGAAGLAAGLLAVRRGWRPRPELLIGCSLIGVLMMMLLPPIGSSDMRDDAIYGRIAALGHSPYTMTPRRLEHAGDPVARYAPKKWSRDASPYGPLMTGGQAAASLLGGDSASRTIFWLKVENALAFLAVALALDRFFRADPAGRTRAHLLWTVNPLMFLAVMAGGHNDVLGMFFGLLAVLALRRLDLRGGLLAGLMVGAAISFKAPFALFGLGLAIAALKSRRALTGLALGAAAVIAPSYAVAGWHAVTSVLSESVRASDLYHPWLLVAYVVPYFRNGHATDALALVATVVLAGLLLWRMPAGPPGLPAVRPVLALTLAWLICSPQQRAWYDVLIFPLLALMPATRLDWIVLARGFLGAVGQLPGNALGGKMAPYWLRHTDAVLYGYLVPMALAGLAIALVWLCVTRRIDKAALSAGRLAPPEPLASG